MYRIGLIDDEPAELTKVRRTIKVNAPKGMEFDFKSYEIPEKREDAIDQICSQVIDDIEGMNITALIIDYKIMVKALKVNGTDILKEINDTVSKFPVIILTERVEESIQPDHVDADKVYKKKDFFKLEEEYSKEKINHIFDSMAKYVKQRDELTLTLSELKKKLESGDRSVIEDVLKLEEKLDEFVPVEQTQIDRTYDVNRMKAIVDLIAEANKLME